MPSGTKSFVRSGANPTFDREFQRQRCENLQCNE
jgi:hypothetical protein